MAMASLLLAMSTHEPPHGHEASCSSLVWAAKLSPGIVQSGALDCSPGD